MIASASARPEGVEVFSGHESFACRYGWLPKLHEAVGADPELFADDDRAMAELGLGARAARPAPAECPLPRQASHV